MKNNNISLKPAKNQNQTQSQSQNQPKTPNPNQISTQTKNNQKNISHFFFTCTLLISAFFISSFPSPTSATSPTLNSQTLETIQLPSQIQIQEVPEKTKEKIGIHFKNSYLKIKELEKDNKNNIEIENIRKNNKELLNNYSKNISFYGVNGETLIEKLDIIFQYKNNFRVEDKLKIENGLKDLFKINASLKRAIFKNIKDKNFLKLSNTQVFKNMLLLNLSMKIENKIYNFTK